MELVIFTSFKPFVGDAAILQGRSLANWRLILPMAQIVNFETKSAIVEDYPATINTVQLDEQGRVPSFGAMVKSLIDHTDADLFLYVNGDILFDKTILTALRSVPPYDFLLTGQRIDRNEQGERCLHRPSGMDYFLFRRGMFANLPSVTMGRAYCDSALVADCLRRSIPVIDASFAVRVEHQYHYYGHIEGGRESVWNGADARQNLKDNGLRPFAPHCIDATQTLLSDGRIVPTIRPSLLRRLEISLYYRHGWRWCPPFNALWNLVTRGGRYGKNPHWEGVKWSA